MASPVTWFRCRFRLCAFLAGLSAAASQGEEPVWGLRPYRVNAVVVADDAPGWDAPILAALRSSLENDVSLHLPSAWELNVTVADAPLRKPLRVTPTELSLDSPGALAVRPDGTSADYVVLLLLERASGGSRVRGRGWHRPRSSWGPTVERRVARPQHWNRAAFQALVRAAAPVARVSEIAENQVRLRPQAAGLAVRDPQLIEFREGAVAVLARETAESDGGAPLRWTYLVVEKLDAATATCRVVSRYQDPLAAVGSGPGWIALQLPPGAGTTQLQLATEDNQTAVLAGCEVYAQTGGTGEERLLGQVDASGRFDATAGYGVQLLAVRTAGATLVTFPLVPGLERELRIRLSCPGWQVELQSAAAEFDRQLLEAVTRKQILLARATHRSQTGREAEGKSLLEQARGQQQADHDRLRKWIDRQQSQATGDRAAVASSIWEPRSRQLAEQLGGTIE